MKLINAKKACCVGNDSDDFMFSMAITVIVIALILTLMVYGGVFIGAFHSLKNYFGSLKENVIDSNRTLAVE